MPTKIAVLIASILLMVASSSAAGADPVWMVVTTDTESVRCGDQEIYYTIAEFNQGTMVAADETSGDFTKIRYPASLGALIGADDARLIKAGSQVQLLVDSKLKALSMLRGASGSWNAVYEQSIPAETTMSVLEVLRDDDSEVVGYRVAPPRPPVVESFPYAYIRTASLRAATPAEIKAHQGGKKITSGRNPLSKAPSNAPSKATPIQKPNPEAVTEIIPDPIVETDPEPTLEAGTIDLREEMAIPESTPEQQPVEITNTLPVVEAKPVFSPEKATRRPLGKITAASLESLEASFTKARLMPRAELDEALPELLAEFTRTRNAISDVDSEARPLDQRIEWLNIRIQTRDQRRAIASALASADFQSIELARKIEQWDESRAYALVGRLMLSGVYTGEHLPLLYRVRAPDPITGDERTIGYLSPSDDQDLRVYLGQVIGVVGNPVQDDALALTVLTPTRIDRMPGQ